MNKATQTPAQRRADNALIRRALRLLEERLEYGRTVLANPQAVRDFLRLRMGELEHEVFIAIWLDAQNRLIEIEELFRGTLTQTSVYPREVVKSALAHNAGAVILAHNHPSGVISPSRADEALTASLKQSLALVDVKVLDHFIVGGAKEPLSFAERGLL
jgi:DNA repair protein RadC